MSDPTPAQRMAAHYAAEGPPVKDRLARTHRHDPRLETLLAWRASDPGRCAQLSVATRLALGHCRPGQRTSFTRH
jgi:hypothetical protein